MLKAFDALLQTEVSANIAAANSDNEAFRYECLCCGEEAFLAAQDSTYKATHFRHRSGNNDKECELYLGQYGMVPSSPSTKNKRQDRVEFYYQHIHKAFYMCFRFNADEISAYESVGMSIEVRSFRHQRPFFMKRINHTNFIDDTPEIRRIYQGIPVWQFDLVYGVANSGLNSEILFASDSNLLLESNIEGMNLRRLQ